MSEEISYAPPDDPEMHRAMVEARATFKYLWRELTWEYRRIVPGVELAAIKAAFSDPGRPEDIEHMWVTDVLFDGEQIRGVLANDPIKLRSVEAGDPVILGLNDLEDWLYILYGRAFGGFTIQVMRSRMDPEERHRHDEAWGAAFPDPPTVDRVPNWEVAARDPEAIRRGGPDVSPGDPHAEHPMSENMGDSLAEAIDRDPRAFLHDADEQGLTTLHYMALGGSEAGVRALLEKGADPSRPDHRGTTALDLARKMGWPRVVALLEAATQRR